MSIYYSYSFYVLLLSVHTKSFTHGLTDTCGQAMLEHQNKATKNRRANTNQEVKFRVKPVLLLITVVALYT